VEKVDSFKNLGVHITDKLKLSTHTDSVVKKAQQRIVLNGVGLIFVKYHTFCSDTRFTNNMGLE
jgi:hypothetical protein